MIEKIECEGEECSRIIGRRELADRGDGTNGWRLRPTAEDECNQDSEGYFILCSECKTKNYQPVTVPSGRGTSNDGFQLPWVTR